MTGKVMGGKQWARKNRLQPLVLSSWAWIAFHSLDPLGIHTVVPGPRLSSSREPTALSEHGVLHSALLPSPQAQPCPTACHAVRASQRKDPPQCQVHTAKQTRADAQCMARIRLLSFPIPHYPNPPLGRSTSVPWSEGAGAG